MTLREKSKNHTPQKFFTRYTILTKGESNIDYIIDGIMPDARREEQYIRPKGASIIKTQPISVLLYMYVEFTSAILRQSTS